MTQEEFNKEFSEFFRDYVKSYIDDCLYQNEEFLTEVCENVLELDDEEITEEDIGRVRKMIDICTLRPGIGRWLVPTSFLVWQKVRFSIMPIHLSDCILKFIKFIKKLWDHDAMFWTLLHDKNCMIRTLRKCISLVC
jgi:hypothetical protein